ncbi:ankyrin repeat-containing domain protein [Boeremia exigua]|uniref:ankyrin repeat-containing domain protein n=1 Tax=Boeremia exigua TaxID=749465 RepID=UPI001E8D7CA7|nr:ankyrin repeat-containing domain protein [Boeremia exigua]KAH6643209.1 ankyrin repeat-containing domain protein [Boeremia exigua]
MNKHSVNWEEVGTETQMHVKRTLVDKSDGMFRWTYLQWEQLKIIKSEKYIKARLDKLPKTLSEAYQEILDGCDPDSPNLRMLQRAVRWVMCAREPLNSRVLLSALKAESESRDGADCFEQSDLTERKLEDACRHLVVKDPELGVWKFPHASVLDYFKGEKFEWISNAPAQLTVFMINCLKSCCSNYPSKWPPQHIEDDVMAIYKWYHYDRLHMEDPLDPPHPLQKYILLNWVEHTRGFSSHDAKTTGVDQALQQFFGEPGPQRSSKEYRVFVQMVTSHWRFYDLLWSEIGPVDNNVFGTIALGLHKALAGWWDKNLDIPSLVNDDNSDLLSIAATYGQSETCQHLLNAGCDIQSAVCASIRGHKIDTLRLLLRRVANLNIAIDGHSYLCCASSYRSLKCLQLLLQYEADPDLSCNNDSQGKGRCQYGNALVNAAYSGYLDGIQALVKQKAAVNPINIGGDFGSPLAAAVYEGHLECARFLVEHGADIHANLESGKYGSPLVAALWGEQLDCARFLIQQGADVNAAIPCRGFGSPLAAAIHADKHESAAFVIEYGADVNADLRFGDFGSPLGVAASTANERLSRLLLNHGAEPNASLNFGKFGSPLAAAVAEGDLGYVRFLVDSGADVHATLKVGEYGSALAAAVLGEHDGSLHMIKFLVEENEVDLAQLVKVPPRKRYRGTCDCYRWIRLGERCAVAVYLLRERGLNFEILASLGFIRERLGLSRSSSSGSST